MATPPFDFDQANPLDTALVSTYPANERAFRENVEDWCDFEHGSASGRHKIPTGDDTARDAITDWEAGSLWFSTQGSDNVMEYNTGTKATPVWDRGGAFPAGTKMLFQQTAAPTGWTKDTTHNNKALRLQTGTVTTGGADSFTTVFGSGAHRATDSHVLSVAEMPAHTHEFGTNNNAAGSGVDADQATAGTLLDTGSTGGGGGHTHNIDAIDLQFVDVIIATRD